MLLGSVNKVRDFDRLFGLRLGLRARNSDDHTGCHSSSSSYPGPDVTGETQPSALLIGLRQSRLSANLSVKACEHGAKGHVERGIEGFVVFHLPWLVVA